MNKNGGVVLVVMFLVALFIASLVFLVFAVPIATLVDVAHNDSSILANPQALRQVQRIESVWYIVPILTIIMIIIWAINRALYREPLSGY